MKVTKWVPVHNIYPGKLLIDAGRRTMLFSRFLPAKRSYQRVIFFDGCPPELIDLIAGMKLPIGEFSDY